MSLKQTCPRRMEDLGPWERKEDLDKWTRGGGLAGQESELSCSFCGSLHPDTFMEWIEAGCEVGPTDKSYKAYMDGPEGRRAKFYYQHLSREQKQRFVDLYNDRTMKIGYPGNFYQSPFFMADALKGSS